jgi:hypothetical protein
MLKCFFDIRGKDKNLFDGLEITKYKEITDKYQNTYPVIFMTLKGLKEPTFDDFITALKMSLSNLYSSHEYIYESGVLNEAQKKYFKDILLEETPVAKLKFSIKNLISYLYKYHKQKVILLIDEYDAPIDNSEMENFYGEMIKFMRGFFGDALKTNEYLEFAVITGVQRIAKEGLFSDLNNLRVCGIMNEEFSDKFGFTENEVNEACKEYGLQDNIQDIKDFYDGYKFGNKDIYNPWSILNYLEKKKLQPYWVNTGATNILKNIFAKGEMQLKYDMEGLFFDIPITMSLGNHITYPIEYTSSNSFWTLLLNAGYIKPYGDLPEYGDEIFKAVLVNKEVKRAFKSCIDDWLSDQKGMFSKGFLEFLTAITEGNTQGIETSLNQKLLLSPSYYDMVNENSYHMFLLGMLQPLGDGYIISSNREEGLGRADVTLRPKNKAKAAVIIEFKHVKGSRATKKSVMAEAQKSFKQVESQGYAAEMTAEGYTKIFKYGIAFNGKYCIVKNNL